ncbi:hypothetical protein [Halohasta litorea]|uniref:Uncharacterized protein n=1 Tax=Halohasta litorea TaxID=869891 RepID=A0ABD6D3A8_9EURY|nr:hypothetical protein [Halohasta litorea]
MATKHPTRTALVADLADWKVGVIGGLGGGLVFGILLSMLMPDIIGGAIPGLYGFSSGVAGWTIHMAHSAVLGVVFAGFARAVC